MKPILAMIALVMMPSVAAACQAHEQITMSCAEGMEIDTQTGICVPVVSS